MTECPNCEETFKGKKCACGWSPEKLVKVNYWQPKPEPTFAELKAARERWAADLKQKMEAGDVVNPFAKQLARTILG